ncbi:MAG: hypothetical protein JWN04_2821 [Myxococcaceae bacterium]|nr:hypothetical protein [Myxococcaceae bacterium]
MKWHYRLGLCITFAGSLVGIARGALPPKIDFRVYRLKVAPTYVMFVYPGERGRGGGWDDTPTSAVTVIEEGGRIVLGRPGPPPPALYLMKAGAFRLWRAAHPVAGYRDDESAAEELVNGKQVVRCDAQLRPLFDTGQWELLQGNAKRCHLCFRISARECLRNGDIGYAYRTGGHFQ